MAKRRAEREQFRSRVQSYRSRQVGGRAETQRILIICGGETEEWYFDKFRAIVRSMKLRVLTNGVDPQTLVQWAEKIKTREEVNGDFDQVWCVFDRDDFGPRYEQAFVEARRAGFLVAASDPCFELWFVLHLRDMQQRITTADCCRLLETLLKKTYSKTDASLFADLNPHRPKASERADKLLQQHETTDGAAPGNPSTTVHKLIAVLMPNGLR